MTFLAIELIRPPRKARNRLRLRLRRFLFRITPVAGAVMPDAGFHIGAERLAASRPFGGSIEPQRNVVRDRQISIRPWFQFAGVEVERHHAEPKQAAAGVRWNATVMDSGTVHRDGAGCAGPASAARFICPGASGGALLSRPATSRAPG